jgi:hypothetical protein
MRADNISTVHLRLASFARGDIDRIPAAPNAGAAAAAPLIVNPITASD